MIPSWKPLNKISLKFYLRIIVGSLQEFFYVKPSKDPGPNLMCTKLIIHVRVALKSRLHYFLSSSLCQLQISKIYEKALVVAMQKILYHFLFKHFQSNQFRLLVVKMSLFNKRITGNKSIKNKKNRKLQKILNQYFFLDKKTA